MAEDKEINCWSLRRAGATLAAAGLMTPAIAQKANATELEADLSSEIRYNLLAFRTIDRRDYLKDLTNGITICNANSRALHYWSEDKPIDSRHRTSVPPSRHLSWRGRAKAVDKKVNRPWRPTQAMRKRNPEWPDVVEGGGLIKPLGARALCLSPAFTASTTPASSVASPRRAASAFVTNTHKGYSNSPESERRSC